ncbi:MAG: hypothetical protein JNJ99_03625 [Crocinitomicaceae bacterium]|nr:hypothetical protein [Crocinitomicaceae bacterium]
MKSTLLFIFSGLFLLSSCDQSQKLTHTERKLIGQWEYDKVEYFPYWGFKENQTNEFESLQLEILKDFTITMQNSNTGEIYTGVWEVNIINLPSSNGNNMVAEEFIASLSGNISGEVIQIIWENIAVDNSRIRADHDDKQGIFNYKLRKL